ncbi:hypothetical protein [Brevibacillus choshinensis]|uniref:Uncharacterized protein n=1 Tax=Brevibacillus choshinensis TaxID=54911 RepID=A0ABX7FR48_BRECH|nr:hypothetical protein [Brevibacillus choshinensis]QRG68280.1 hypothetical protein JNE38_03650 [Brevibacillus choshinensis]
MEHAILGSIISGELDREANEFTVTRLKTISTHSVWSIQQVREMYELLLQVLERGDESLVVTTGTLPLLVNRSEMEVLRADLESVLATLPQNTLPRT